MDAILSPSSPWSDSSWLPCLARLVNSLSISWAIFVIRVPQSVAVCSMRASRFLTSLPNLEPILSISDSSLPSKEPIFSENLESRSLIPLDDCSESRECSWSRACSSDRFVLSTSPIVSSSFEIIFVSIDCDNSTIFVLIVCDKPVAVVFNSLSD